MSDRIIDCPANVIVSDSCGPCAELIVQKIEHRISRQATPLRNLLVFDIVTIFITFPVFV